VFFGPRSCFIAFALDIPNGYFWPLDRAVGGPEYVKQYLLGLGLMCYVLNVQCPMCSVLSVQCSAVQLFSCSVLGVQCSVWCSACSLLLVACCLFEQWHMALWHGHGQFRDNLNPDNVRCSLFDARPSTHDARRTGCGAS
jgi:hypothetical protein